MTLTGTLTAATSAEAETVQCLLPEHVRLSRAEPGCLRFDVIRTDDPLVWHLHEEFIDAAAFAAHQVRTSATVWAEKTTTLRRDFTKAGL